MKLLTKEIIKKLPKLYSQEYIDDPMVICKFFTTWSNWKWYVIEFDGEDLFFGYVVKFEQELGYFGLSELEKLNRAGGIGAERDLYFKPCKLSEIKKLHKREY